MENIVVLDGEISLQNHMDGEWDLNIPADGDPNVIIIEGGGQTYPHYQGDYTVTPSTTAQVLDTDGKVMDDDVTVQAVQAGSATTPATIITADPTISVSSGGLITATVSKTQQITPTVVEGYVEAGTAGNVGVSGSNTEQLSVQGAQTIYPSTSDQEIASGKYLTGKQTFKKVVVSGLSADKIVQGTTVKIGDVDDDDRIASVMGTAQQGITPTGTKSITANGTGIDVASYQYADVAVPNSYSQSDEGKVVSNGALVAQTSDTVTTNDTYDTTLINSLTVNVSGGGGTAQVATGSFTLASEFSLTTSAQTLPGLDLDFQPDLLVWMIDRASFANLTPSGQHIYGMFAIRKSISPYMLNSVVPTVTEDFNISLWYTASSNSDSPSGYALDRFANITSTYYSRFSINADGTVSVGRWSSAGSSIYAGKYNYYAVKL